MGFKRRYKNFIEKFLSGENGQVFFQYVYNIAAAVVIIGALGKLEHWSFGGVLITIGLLVEAFVFFISAFDKPAKTYLWDRVFPVLDTNDEEDRPAFGSGGGGGSGIVGGVTGGVIGSVAGSSGNNSVLDRGFVSAQDSQSLTNSIQKMATAADALAKMSEDMQRFTTATDNLSGVTEDISQSSRGYVDNMENLNRNLQGLSNIYEIQLQGVRSQIDAVERINAGLIRMKDMYESSVVDSSIFRTETEKMTQQLHALNSVYARMLNAMTVNMYGGMPGANPGYNPNPYNNPPYNPQTPTHNS
ncbi:gliding motility protein GldL [Bacteroidia bacterium]|nr:gliding motility protein GldL [Bacteroidia bacterium]